MPQYKINLQEHESSRPLSGLLITLYGTPEVSVPADIQDPHNWEKLRQSNWKSLNVVRLSSAATGNDGTAYLEYEYNHTDEEAGRFSNLWFTIQTPQVLGSSTCGRILHAACEIMVNPSEFEEIMLRVPRSMVDKFGIFNRLSPIIDSQRTSDDLNMYLETIEGGLIDSPENVETVFATNFNKEIIESIGNSENEISHTIAPMSIPLSFGVITADDTENRIPNIYFDKNKKQLIVENVNGQSGKPLVFDGVARFTNQRLTNKKMNKPHITLDENTGKVQIALPKVPQTLEISETEPTSLYMQSIKSANKTISSKKEGE